MRDFLAIPQIQKEILTLFFSRSILSIARNKATVKWLLKGGISIAETKTIQELEQEAQREYQRQWRRKNPDKVREMNRRYWEKKAREKAKEGVKR